MTAGALPFITRKAAGDGAGTSPGEPANERYPVTHTASQLVTQMTAVVVVIGLPFRLMPLRAGWVRLGGFDGGWRGCGRGRE